MNIDRTEFQFVCHLKQEVGSDGAVVPFMPQHRYMNAKNLPLNKYGEGPFCKFRIPGNFNTSGVYALVVEDTIKYIGECTSLSSRYNSGYGNISPRNCFKGGQETNCRLNVCIYVEVQCGRQVELWFHSTREHKQLANRLLAASNYEWNRGQYA